MADEFSWDDDNFEDVLIQQQQDGKAQDAKTSIVSPEVTPDDEQLQKIKDKYKDEEAIEEEKLQVAKPKVQAAKPKQKIEIKQEPQRQLTPQEEKELQIRLQQEADLNNARSLFPPQEYPTLQDNFVPVSASDFEQLAAQVTDRYIIIQQKHKLYNAFIKNILKAALRDTKIEDIKDIEKNLRTIWQGKEQQQKRDKEQQKKKDVSSMAYGKKGLKQELNDYYGAGEDQEYDEEEDDDFM